MSVIEIEQAITQLPRAQVNQISTGLEEFQARLWDEQIERDAAAGKFDAMIQQAKAEYAAKSFRDEFMRSHSEGSSAT